MTDNGTDTEEIRLERVEPSEQEDLTQYEIADKEPDVVEAKLTEPKRDPRDDIPVDATIDGNRTTYFIVNAVNCGIFFILTLHL